MKIKRLADKYTAIFVEGESKVPSRELKELKVSD